MCTSYARVVAAIEMCTVLPKGLAVDHLLATNERPLELVLLERIAAVWYTTAFGELRVSFFLGINSKWDYLRFHVPSIRPGYQECNEEDWLWSETRKSFREYTHTPTT